MALISPKHNLLFILNPRTASTATAISLYDYLKTKWFPSIDIENEAGEIIIQKKHSTVGQLYEAGFLNQQQLNTYTIAVTVRNPFESLYSLYTKKRLAYQKLRNSKNAFINKIPNQSKDLDFVLENDFSSWIVESYKKPFDNGGYTQVNMKWVEGCNFVLRYENLQEEFARLSQHLKLKKNIEIIMHNTTKGKEAAYREMYSDEARQIMEFLLRDELNTLNYTF